MSTSRHAVPGNQTASDDAARWFCLVLVALPIVQPLPWDFDRVAPLAFVPVALWAGRTALTRAFSRFAQLQTPVRWAAWLALLIAVLSVPASPHPAPAVVMLASWILLAAGALVAGQIVADGPVRGSWLLKALAFSASFGTIAHWVLWRLGAAPDGAFYPHHRVMGLHLLGGTLASTALFFGAVGRGRIGWLLVGVITWGGLLWTGSRAPLAAVIVSVLVWLVIAPGRARRRLAASAALHAIGGLIVSFVLDAKVQYLGWTNLWRRTVEVASAKELTSNRSDFWYTGWQRGLESPWLGRGPDAYRYLEPKLEGAQPHNVLLQWFLDLGVIGGLAIVFVVTWALWRGLRRTNMATTAAAWPVIALASFVAGQLDGFFYHQAALFTTALAFGIIACAANSSETPSAASPQRGFRAWPIVVVVSMAVLLMHSWLFYRVARSPPPAPADAVVRVWYAFPSTAVGLDRWIWTWSDAAPDAALSLSRHAQLHSAQQDYFHVVTAGILLRRGDRARALQEMDHAVAIAPWQRRSVVQAMRDQVATGN